MAAFKRKPAAGTASAPKTARAPRAKKKKEREFLRETDGPQQYELARPVRITLRLSQDEAERLRKRCFDEKVTTQAFLVELLAREGIC